MDGKQVTAYLSSSGAYSSFSVGDTTIRFRTSARLNKYIAVKKWDAGYLVVTADYQSLGETEEYIDMVSILDELYVDPAEFLASVCSVEVRYDKV